MKRFISIFISLLLVLSCYGQRQVNVKEQATTKNVEKILKQLSLDQKIQLVHGSRDTDHIGFNGAGYIKGFPELGIPDVFIADGEHGVTVGGGATGLPAKVGLAATFDVDAAETYGMVIGEEAKALGIHVMLTPRVNIARDPISVGYTNGGNYQTYGEDPHLNGMIGAGEAKGIQTDNNAIAQLKQMFGSSNGSAQGAGTSVIDKQTMHEIYMAPFEYVIKAGVGSAMTNYSRVSNTNASSAVWTSEWGYMMNEMLRNRWGFEGFIFPDWGGTYSSNAILEGLDVEMGGGSYFNNSDLKAKIESGHINMDFLDNAVRRLLYTLEKFDMLGQQNFRDPGYKTIKPQMREDQGKKAQYLSERSAVLLKNDEGVLPVQESEIEDIVIIGSNARVLAHSIFQESAYGFEERMISPIDAMMEITGKNISFSPGNDLFGEAVPSRYLIADDGSQGLSCYKALPASGNGMFFPMRTEDASSPLDPGKSIQSMMGLPEEKSVRPNTGMTPMMGGMMPPQETQNTLSVPEYGELIAVHSNVDFVGREALSTGRYTWHGQLVAPEAGYFFIALQSSYPTGLETIEKAKTINDVSVSINGTLKIDGKNVSSNPETRGAPFPSSFVVTTPEGFNNAGCYVYLTKGNHEIEFNANSFFDDPLEVRLSWVTPSMERANIDLAVDAAKKATKAIVFVWHESSSESLDLEQCQDELVFKVSQANPNTVVVINSGDPIAMPWVNQVKGIVEMWYPGQDGGRATANILLGNANPGGKLPVTFPVKIEDVPARSPGFPERQAEVMGRSETSIAYFTEGVNNGYRWYDANNIKPLFAFGHGLSYTVFEYSDLSLSGINDGKVKVTFNITNIGEVDGSEVAQIYVGRPDVMPEGVQFSPKLLGGFTRIDLKAGESKEVTVEVDQQRFCYWDIESDGWVLPDGDREIMVASSSRDIRLTGKLSF